GELTGEVVTLKEVMDDGLRALIVGRADEERVAELADSLKGEKLRSGDTVLMDSRSGLLLEKLPRPEVEELVLEEVPDIAYEDVGGLDSQIEQIADAVELPFVHHELFAEYKLPAPKGILLYGPPGCGKTLIAKAVANSLATIVAQLLAEIDGVETLKNVIVIGASNREDLIDPAILRPGRLDVKIKIERPDSRAAGQIFSRYLTTDLPLDAEEVRDLGGGDSAKAVELMIERTVEEMYSDDDKNRFLEVTY